MAQAVKDKDHLQARMEAEGEKRVERETQLRSNITRLLVQKLGSNMSQEEISQLEKDVAALIEKNKIAKKGVKHLSTLSFFFILFLFCSFLFLLFFLFANHVMQK